MWKNDDESVSLFLISPLNGSDFERPATGGFPFIARGGEQRAKGENF